MEPVPLSREARLASWRVFALVLLSTAYFYQSSGHNEAARFDQMRSLSEHGEWWIDRFAWNSADIIKVGEHTYPGKAPGTTFLGAMPWYAARWIFHRMPIDFTKQLILVTYVLTILMSGFPTALVSLMILRFLARNGWTEALSTLLSLGYGLGTLAFPFGTLFFGHQLSAAFAFGGFYLVWSSRWITGRPRDACLLLSGFLIGFLPVIEHPGAIASGLIGIYAIATLGLRESLPVIVGAVGGILPLPIYNEVAFGSPQALGYSFYAKEGSPFPAHQVGFMGVTWPRLDVLREISFKPQRGLFYANPWLVFALISPLFFRRMAGLAREFVLCAAIFACFFAFNSGYGDSIIYWGGGFSFGPRHLLIALPFAVLLAAVPMKSRFVGPVIGALIVVTMFLMLPATAIDPRLPYEPSEPFFDFYLPLYARGLFARNPAGTFGDTVLFGSSGAWNLGRAFGLPRDLEVLPLTLVWAFAAVRLFKPQTRMMRFAQAGVAGVAVVIGVLPAWPRLSPGSVTEPGLCRAISPDLMWPYFTDFPLPGEPSPTPQLARVAGPSINLTEQDAEIGSTSLSSVAVTFSGRFEPEASGWHIFKIETIGKAALYIDGLERLKIEGGGEFQETKAEQIYLARVPHDFMVRYMSNKPVRRLSVSVGLRDGPMTPMEAGLTRGTCR